MHYSANAFSANGQPTIVPKVTILIDFINKLTEFGIQYIWFSLQIKGVELGQREGLSRGDVKKIRKMYKCKAEGAKRRDANRYW